jgi:hypothetical protein
MDELVNVSTAVLDAYCKCGVVEEARAVFDWTARQELRVLERHD